MNKLNLKKVIPFIILMASLLTGFSAMAKGNNDVANAQNRVMSITTAIVKELQVNKSKYTSNRAALDTLIRTRVLPFMDFDAMSKLTLGKHWRSASASQRTRFVSAYREMLIRSYGKIMLKYAGATVRAGKSVPGRRAGYVSVRTTVTPRGGSPIAANYDVRNKTGDWKAINVQVGGVNLITNFRTNFTREVSAKGLDALIARLNKTKK